MNIFLLPFSFKGSTSFAPGRDRGIPTDEEIMQRNLSMLSAAVIGGAVTVAVIGAAAIGGLNAQVQTPGVNSSQQQSRIFVISEQTLTNPAKYNTDYAPKVQRTILDHQGRFIARTDQITNLQGDPGPQRIVILGFDSMDQVQRWQNSADYKDLKPLRDQVMKIRQFAITTCPQGQSQGTQAAGQTTCPNN